MRKRITRKSVVPPSGALLKNIIDLWLAALGYPRAVLLLFLIAVLLAYPSCGCIGDDEHVEPFPSRRTVW